jgi:hypothetical protein
MNSILSIGRNPIARLLALAIVLYSLGVIPLPKLGWSPCKQWFPVSVYVLTPGAGGHVLRRGRRGVGGGAVDW